MLFRHEHLEGIKSGKITRAFRRWKRPSVKTGGRLRTKIGVLAIDDVATITTRDITDKSAREAGFDSKRELIDELNSYREGVLYEIEFHLAGPDDRAALREKSSLSEAELAALSSKIARFGAQTSFGPWGIRFLQMIKEQPGVRAGDLADELGLEKFWFKSNVRKLKELGLTESLPVGYRLSPRGRTVLKALTKSGEKKATKPSAKKR